MSLRFPAIITAIVSLCLLIACGTSGSQDQTDTPSEPTAIPDYENLAKAFCECAQPSIALNEEMAKLQDEGKREEFVAKAEKVSETFKVAMTCAREKKEQLTSAVLNPDDTYQAMINHCPNVPQKFAENLSKTVK